MLACELCSGGSGHFEGATREEAEALCGEHLRDTGWYEQRRKGFSRWLCPACVDDICAWAKEAVYG